MVNKSCDIPIEPVRSDEMRKPTQICPDVPGQDADPSEGDDVQTEDRGPQVPCW